MSDSQNKLQCRDNYNHWKILDLMLDLNYFYFSNPNPNPTYLPKCQTLSPNHQFSQRYWCVEYYSVHVCMAWSHKFRKSENSLDTGMVVVAVYCFLRQNNGSHTHDVMQHCVVEYSAEAIAYLRAKFYTSNNIYWFHSDKRLVKDHTVCTYKWNTDCVCTYGWNVDYGCRQAHRVHLALWMDCCRFINSFYQFCFLAVAEYTVELKEFLMLL